jgi:uncharacterized protein
MIERNSFIEAITAALARSRVVALMGPRQSGKATLARQFVPPNSANYFDLEDPVSLARLAQPMTALQSLTGTIVIDEIQRMPELFPILRVLADRQPLPARFLILGSASPALIKQSSESLAGRMELIEVSGLSLNEAGTASHARHWLRGGFPLSFLAASDEDSFIWRKNFVQTVLERDLPQLGSGVAAPTMQRFWAMLAHYHGQLWNAAELARAMGVSEATVRRYLDLLDGVFMVRQLQPWHENLKKRQVKSPKIYFRDSGLLHQLLGIRSEADLQLHPRLGASWEGYVLEEILKAHKPDEAWFWATHAGAELDLLMMKQGKRIGVEIKRMDAPRLTPSMKIAMEDLRLDELVVVYPGEQRYSLATGVEVVPVVEMLTA